MSFQPFGDFRFAVRDYVFDDREKAGQDGFTVQQDVEAIARRVFG